MGAPVKHLHRHPETGRLSYRRTFPAELRAFLPGDRVGHRELKVSLGAKSLSEPHAAQTFARAAAEYERLASLAQNAAKGTHDLLTAPLIRFLADSYLAYELASDEAMRWGTPSPPSPPYTSRADREGDYDDGRKMLESYDAEGLVDLWGLWGVEYGAALGYTINAAAPEFPGYCRALADAGVRLWLDLEKRAGIGQESVLTETPDLPAVPQLPKAQAEPLPLLFEQYAETTGMTPGSRNEARRFIQRLIDFLGQDDARRITPDDLLRWRDSLSSEALPSGKKRDALTVKKYLSTVKALMRWAVNDRRLSSNPAKDIQVASPRKATLRDREFTMDEARSILRASLQPASSNMAEGHVRARRWIPWICAYTGARVNEISQMRSQDLSEIDGVWALKITPEAGTVKGQKARVVPLHPHLVEQGFPAIVAALGDGPIFYDPKLQRVAEAGNRHFKKVGERLAEWVRKDVGISDRNIQPNHAWRHLFKTRAMQAEIPERVTDAIQGHAPRSVGQSYGSVPLELKATAIGRMPYFEIE